MPARLATRLPRSLAARVTSERSGVVTRAANAETTPPRAEFPSDAVRIIRCYCLQQIRLIRGHCGSVAEGAHPRLRSNRACAPSDQRARQTTIHMHRKGGDAHLLRPKWACWSAPDRSPTGENQRCLQPGIFRLNGIGVPWSVPVFRTRQAAAWRVVRNTYRDENTINDLNYQLMKRCREIQAW
jgi:hypothetical protein